MDLSLEVKQRFSSDMRIDFPIFDEPYFSYYIDLYDEHYKTKEKMSLLLREIEKAGSQENFLENYYNSRNMMLTKLKETESFKAFNSMDMSPFIVNQMGCQKKDVFNKLNIGKTFVSIDLVKANFQALKYINKEIVLGADSYEELVSKFTDMEYIKNSKYIRQVVFGNLNPKRTITVERYMIEQVMQLLIERGDLKVQNISMLSADELVYELTSDLNVDNINGLVRTIKEILNIDVDIEVYELEQIGNVQPFFRKKFLNKDGSELICIPQDLRPQVLKYIKNESVNEFDKSFRHQGMFAVYKDGIII